MSSYSDIDSCSFVDTLGAVGSNARAPELAEGTRIHRYIILGLIGKGGMGAVYKAYDPELDRRIAIKVMTLLPQKGETVSRPQARLMREAQALAKLSHPNVVAVFDVGIRHDGVYIAMEYVEGKTLRDWLKEDQPTQAKIIEVFLAAGHGLGAAHKQGIVHRDFKPDNLLVGKNNVVKVLDFGLARAAGFEDLPKQETSRCSQLESGEQLLSKPLTQVGTRLGTTAYMAPEHFRMQELDEKTDQFSFCVTLFEAFYGQRPFRGQTTTELEENVVQGKAHVPRGVEVPEWIQSIIFRGISVSKADRFSSMQSLVEALAHDPEQELLFLRARRKRRVFIMGVVLMALILPIAVWYGLRYGTVLQCKNRVAEKVQTVWSEKNQAAIAEAFHNTNKSFAAGTWQRVRQTFRNYISDWQRLRNQTCEEAWLGMHSEELFDGKIRCLNKRFQEFENLAAIFSEADAKVVQKAAQAAANLSALSVCLNEESLDQGLNLPHENIRSQVESERAHLIRVKAFENAGKYAQGLQHSRNVLKQAQALGYKPLIAEALYWVGDLEGRSGRYRMAQDMLQHAYWEGVESSYLELMARASIRLIYIVGYRLTLPQEGLYWGWLAKTAISLLNWPSVLASKWNAWISIVYGAKGDQQKEMEHLREALRIDQQNLGPGHVEVGHRLNNIGVAFWRSQDYEQALEFYKRALKIYETALGAQHPYVASSLNNIGLVLWKQKDYDGALEYLHRALEIWQDSLGKEHPLTIWPLAGLGEVLAAQEKYTQAMAKFRRATEICQTRFCDPEPLGMAYFGLAKVLLAHKNDRPQARSYIKKARDVYSKASGLFKPELQELDRWKKKIQ